VVGGSWFGVFDPPPALPWTGGEPDSRASALDLTVESTPRRSKRRKLLTAATDLLLGPAAAPRSLPVTPITPAAMTSAAALAFWTPPPVSQVFLDDDTGSSSPSREPDSDDIGLGSGSQISHDSRESNSRSSFVQGSASQHLAFHAPTLPRDDVSLPHLTLVPFSQVSTHISPSASSSSSSSASSSYSCSISLPASPTVVESTATCSAPVTPSAFDPSAPPGLSGAFVDSALASLDAASVWVRVFGFVHLRIV
jgi:hypothetical protein